MSSTHSNDPFDALLRGVSRSFYLSIRLLPAPLRHPVGVAYLLARATDTVADTTSLPSTQRLETLHALAAAVQGVADAGPQASRHVLAFAPHQEDGAERRLMQAWPQCLAALAQLAPQDRQDVRTVLRHITHGQVLDVERFGAGQGLQALETQAQVDEYTWLVAGSVGEFWTGLGIRHLPRFANLPDTEMRALGRIYGQALQRINILRDAGSDLASGRCYFSAEELAAHGLSPHDISARPESFAPIRRRWLAQASEGLESGMRYALALGSARMRAASALPALIGMRTLMLQEAAGAEGLRMKVKLPRSEVRWMLARLAFTAARRSALAAQFAHLRGAARWDNRGR